ncbi:MAG: hypothetical protein QXU20_03725 [Candidatus Woesearchaeota archaeon]
MRKKAQTISASYAGGLIIAIAVLIFFYVLLIPPESRRELLNESIKNESQQEQKNEAEYVLLLENPGRIMPKTITEKYSEGHKLNDVRIYSITQAITIKRINPFYIGSTFFSQDKKTFVFKIDDIKNIRNVVLSFNAESRKGRLIIKLNGVEIFNSEIKSYNPEPIVLDQDLLEQENTLEFSVSKPGFFSKNHYELSDIKILGYKTDLSRTKSTQTFQITSSEYQTLESMSLKFFIDCYSKENGKVRINLNGYEIGYFTPDCNAPMLFNFPSYYLIQGQNTIYFEIERGDYLIYQLRLEPVFKEITNPTYYFQIPEDEYNKIINESRQVILKLRFADTSEKEAKIYINGYVIGLTTKELYFNKTIDKNYLYKNANSLKIEPEKTIDITELKVYVINKK